MYREYKFRETYLVPINERTLQMISDSRVRAACTRTGCLFLAQGRMCSRKIGGSVMRCCILEVRGVDRTEIFRFNRLMEEFFPNYKLRKVHDAKGVKARLVFNEWTPDNTHLFYGCQRFGLGRGALADFPLIAPCGGVRDEDMKYHTSLAEMIEETPRSAWMEGRRELDGLYTSGFGNCVNFRPILFRRSEKNKTYKGRDQFASTTKSLPTLNYFSDPGYVDLLIDPLLTETLRAREAAMEAERHSNKTVMPSYAKGQVVRGGAKEAKGDKDGASRTKAK